jgi:hypothetical protein
MKTKWKIVIVVAIILVAYLSYDGMTNQMTFEMATKLQHIMENGEVMDGPPMPGQ